MSTRLYVGNLPESVTAERLRGLFAEHGEVSAVKIVTDRYSDEPRGFAFVTMEAESAANVAIANLNASDLDGRALRVNHAPQRERENGHGQPIVGKEGVRIAMQFRERANMTYELDCAGLSVTLRMFPTADEKQWRVEALPTKAADGIVVAAVAPTRGEALVEVASQWCAYNAVNELPLVDWKAVVTALKSVRAV